MLLFVVIEHYKLNKIIKNIKNMEKNFNGQINISRDLRQNKQTIFGKYDLIDIIFIFFAFSISFLIGYILGFSKIKIFDEFTAIIISVIPMIVILAVGFKKVAGIRLFNYLRFLIIDKKTQNRKKFNADITQIGDKYIIGFLIDRKYINKYINKFFNFENLILMQVRYVKNIKKSENKIQLLLNLKYKKNDDIFIDIVNKFSFNTELKGLSNDELINYEKNIDLKFGNKNHQKQNIDIIKNFSFLNKLFIKKDDKEKEVKIKNSDKHYVIYMLNIYDNKKYKKFVNKVKRYAEVICYFKKIDNKKYVNTFLIVDREIKRKKQLTKIEKIDKLCNEYGVILDKLVREQETGKLAISYFMTNPFNNYREFR